MKRKPFVMQGICLFMQLFGMHLCVYSIFLKAGSLYKFAIALAVASIWFTVLAAAPLRRLEHKVKSRYKVPFVKYPVADLFLLFTLIIWGILTVRYLGHIKADMTTLTDAVAHRQRQYNYGVSGAFQPYADRYHGAVGTWIVLDLELLAGLFMSRVYAHRHGMFWGTLPAALLVACGLLWGKAPTIPAMILLIAGILGTQMCYDEFHVGGSRHFRQISVSIVRHRLFYPIMLVCILVLFGAGARLSVATKDQALQGEEKLLKTQHTMEKQIVNFGVRTVQKIQALLGIEQPGVLTNTSPKFTGETVLTLTVDKKPTEDIYLRGFIGAEYDGHSWQPADAEQFDNAAASWKTDGDSRLAIANLPFLRAAYDGAAPQQMTVQRLHADDTYTFAPYNAYFNDYYRLNGDGAAAGQTAQDDTFYYFPRGEAKTLLTARADADPSVLDRLESAYAAYAESRYLATPDGADYGTLQEFCNAAEKEHKLTGDADAIRTFVRSYLNEHCTYTGDPPQPADGADPVLYFLNESHAGSSTQFASAAVVLCRMLGLPARYVVGYAAPQSLFAESDGGWQAVLQDDNAHAWAEVYLAGQGWTPLETTPGMVSELTEDQLAANANAVPTADDTETPLLVATPAPEEDPTAPQARAFWWLLPLAAVLAALAVWGIARARRTPADTVRAEFRALYKKMCRCGLSEGVSSDQEEFKQFLREHTKTAAPQDVETLLALAQTAQFAPGPVSAQTAQQVRGLCRILRKNLHR